MSLCAGVAVLLALVMPPASLAQAGKPDPAAQALLACAPETYEAALTCLATHLPKDANEGLKAENGDVKAHFGLGLWMRNNWSLWARGPLATDMRRLGFTHPDDMSSTIIEGYIARLKNEPFDVAAKAEQYRAYWRDAKKDQEKK